MMRKTQINNKRERGEVFTPPLLVEEMIEKLPQLKIDSKILDPCSGATCVFPIMMMFRYVKQFGKENLQTYINQCLYMVELNEIAAEYSQVILMRYVKMLETRSVEATRQDYIDRYNEIISEYYDYCEFVIEGI